MSGFSEEYMCSSKEYNELVNSNVVDIIEYYPDDYVLDLHNNIIDWNSSFPSSKIVEFGTIS